MKKLNYLFLILFVIDLIILLGYGQAQEERLATYTYYRVCFYWFISSPSPIFWADICSDSCSCIEASFLCLRPWKRFFSS